MQVLIIEDDKNLAQNLKAWFEASSWQVFLAHTGKEATQLIEKQDFDLVMVDVLLTDTTGTELLKTLPEDKLDQAQIVIMSGIVDGDTLTANIKMRYEEQMSFIKKPIDENVVQEILENIESNSLNNIGPLKEDNLDELEKYLLQNKTFYGYQFINLLFLANYSKFEGSIKFVAEDKHETKVHFKNGNIVKVLNNDPESLFGNLLVKHNFSVENVLEDFTKDSKKSIGHQLIEKGVLSPHNLHLILKEQAQMRLSKISSHPSFQASLERHPVEFDETYDMDFNNFDMVELTREYVKTVIKDQVLEDFYAKNKHLTVEASKNIRLQTNNSFLQDYHKLYEALAQEKKTLEDLVAIDEKTRIHTLKMIYFGIVTKSFYFNFPVKAQETSEKLQAMVQKILEVKDQDLFQILDVPWQASTLEVNKSYRKIMKYIHPDKIPSDADAELKARCKQAFEKVVSSYKVLTNQEKRQAYIDKKKSEVFVNILSEYEKGISAVKTKRYKEALKIFSSIINDPRAPRNASLYMSWIKIKLNLSRMQDKSFSVKINSEINNCPMEERTSALFWFVKGLFYQSCNDPAKACSFFKKALLVKQGFTEAKVEMLNARRDLKKQLRKKEKPGLFQFFKKSS